MQELEKREVRGLEVVRRRVCEDMPHTPGILEKSAETLDCKRHVKRSWLQEREERVKKAEPIELREAGSGWKEPGREETGVAGVQFMQECSMTSANCQSILCIGYHSNEIGTGS